MGGAGPGAFSDRGCLLFKMGLATGVLPGQVCLGNVTNKVCKYPCVHKGLLAARSLVGSPQDCSGIGAIILPAGWGRIKCASVSPVYKGMLDPIIISYKLTTKVSVTYYK